MYAVVWGKGIYQSSDGGETFYLMVGSPLNAHRIALASNNTLYVSHETGIKKYNGSQWSDLTIPTNGGWTDFNGIDVDPFNQNNIVISTGAMQWWQKIYLSKDGGSTWTPMDAFTNTVIHDNTWHSGNKGFFFAATSCVLFDPHHQGKVWLGDWYQVWQTPNIYASPAHWYNEVKGNEALVNVVISCPPSGASVFTGHADVNGFRHSNLVSLPINRISQTAAECTGIDYVESNPNYMATVISDDWGGLNTVIQTSQDNGVTWQKVTIPAGSASGKIACNPTDPLKMVYLPSKSVPYYTIDDGKTWTISNGAPSNAINTNYIFEFSVPLVVNRIAPNTYYLYVSNSIYESTDGGANWAKVNQTTLSAITGTDFANFKSGYGTNSNELWLSLGSSGLWRSKDAGKTFAKMNYFSIARMMAWGKPMPGSPNSTLFVYGVANGIWGVYRSTDLGVT